MLIPRGFIPRDSGAFLLAPTKILLLAKASQPNCITGLNNQTSSYLLGAVVDAEDQQEGDEVEASKHILTQPDIQPMIRNIIECSEYVHKACWIPEKRNDTQLLKLIEHKYNTINTNNINTKSSYFTYVILFLTISDQNLSWLRRNLELCSSNQLTKYQINSFQSIYVYLYLL